jgi:hypothetical protein
MDEVLEGERKTMSGRPARRVTDWTAVERKTPGSTPQGTKDVGGTAKPTEQIRSAVIR